MISDGIVSKKNVEFRKVFDYDELRWMSFSEKG